MRVETWIDTFNRFKDIVQAHDRGHPFVNFQEGSIAASEGYKLLVREHAMKLMDCGAWEDNSMGNGEILESVIRAIEISKPTTLANNLVMSQNRYGHASRNHPALLALLNDPIVRGTSSP